jgi:hypothetical protein
MNWAGLDRRQWANLTDKNGNVSRVIVEFKAQLHLDGAAYETRAGIVKGEMTTLVPTLRIAERKVTHFGSFTVMVGTKRSIISVLCPGCRHPLSKLHARP